MADSQSTPRLQLSIEGVVAIIIGILLVITPMNALTRSFFLLIVLLLAVHLAWRTIDRRSWRYLSIVGMVLMYLLIVIALFVAANTSPPPTSINSVGSPSPTPTPTPMVIATPSPLPSSTPTRVISSKPKQLTTKRKKPCTWEDTLLGRCS